MGMQKNATYKVHNGTDFDEINFKTVAGQVKKSDGKSVQDFFDKIETIVNDTSGGIGCVPLGNGFAIQWATTTIDFTNGQEQDISVSYPLQWSASQYGNAWAVVRQNSNNAKFVIANVTPINTLSCTVRVSTTKALTGTMQIRVFAFGII